MKRIVFEAAVGLCLTGCGTLKPADFEDASAQFKPDAYFLGRVRSWGVFENRNGEPRSRFTTESIGTPESAGFMTIRQTFTPEDGRKQERVWREAEAVVGGYVPSQTLGEPELKVLLPHPASCI